MGYTVRSGATISAQVNWTDVNGSAAEVSGETTWTSGDTALVTVAADNKDSTLCRCTSVGPVGTTQVMASAATSGGKQVQAQVDVHVISADATTGSITMQGTQVLGYGPPPPPMMPTGATLK
jgi:hypothetical protein